MKKILIGTHNSGKFKEIACLISKRFQKHSPVVLKIKSPKETGKTFKSNSKLKANFFSKFVNFPVISDDSGLCVKSLNNAPGVYSARLAKKKGGFNNAMKHILKKLNNSKHYLISSVCISKNGAMIWNHSDSSTVLRKMRVSSSNLIIENLQNASSIDYIDYFRLIVWA